MTKEALLQAIDEFFLERVRLELQILHTNCITGNKDRGLEQFTNGLSALDATRDRARAAIEQHCASRT